MLFNQLNIGDKVYIIEVVGTFKKTTEYNEGSVTQVSSIYDEPLPPGQFPMPNQPRKKVVDITIQCNGETKKFTIPENKNDKILELQKEVSELKNIIRKANQMVPPPMKEMLPQDMKNAMDKVGQ